MNKQDWTYKTFKEVFDLQMGRTPDRKDPSLFGGDNIWVSIRDIDGKYIEDSKEHITNEAVIKSGIKLVKKGTVIMSFKLTVGKCAIARKDLYTNEAIMAFNVNKGFILDSSFLYYYLQGYRWSGTNKAVMGLTLNKATISKQKIAIPPIAEQERIVAELDLLSGIIEKKKEQLKAYDQLAQSIFYTMFGDPIDNPKGWETKKLSENVHEMFLGPFGSALKVDSYVPKEESYCMVYEQKHAIQATINLDNHYINKEKFESLQRFEVKPHDFIMSCRGTIGKLYQLPNNAPKGIIHPSLMKIRIKEEFYNSAFFQFLLVKIVANESTNGNCVQMAITAKELGKKELPVPPLLLQEEFAEKVEAIERQKALVQQSIVETQTMFDFTMDKYFG